MRLRSDSAMRMLTPKLSLPSIRASRFLIWARWISIWVGLSKSVPLMVPPAIAAARALPEPERNCSFASPDKRVDDARDACHGSDDGPKLRPERFRRLTLFGCDPIFQDVLRYSFWRFELNVFEPAPLKLGLPSSSCVDGAHPSPRCPQPGPPPSRL